MGPFKDGWTETEVEDVLDRDDPKELCVVPIVITNLGPPDFQWAEDICIRLAAHPDPNVRGNAILAFGYLARTCGKVTRAVVEPIVSAGLSDPHPYVRQHAEGAADDIEIYLNWRPAPPAK
jgi:hypothetical protein